MTSFLKIVVVVPLLFCLFLDADAVQAKGPKYLFKIASLAPDGSIWAKRFQDFADEVVAKTNGEVGFKIYPGGVMGDDRAMYRKMKVGQIQGGGFTMTGIGEVVPDFRVLGVPFLFNSYEELDNVIQQIWPHLKKDFDSEDMVLLAMTEVGFIYTLSTKPINTMADLKNTRSWAPQGDPTGIAFLETVGVAATPLSIPDVLTSLQTGLIDTAFNSFYGAIVMQWFTRINYITDLPFAYAYGALVVDKKSFSRLPPAYAALLESVAKKHFDKLLADTRRSNEEALQVLKNNGIKLIKATPTTQAELQTLREKTVEKLVGSAFSRQIYDETTRSLANFRSTGKTMP